MGMLFCIVGCSGRISEKDYNALHAELESCRQGQQQAYTDRERLAADLAQAQNKIEALSRELSECTSSRQELLDRNIECLEDTKSLLKQISRYKTLTQERKDTLTRLEKAYETLSTSLKEERAANHLYLVKTETAVTIVIPQASLFPTESSAWLTPKGADLARRVAYVVRDLKPVSVSVAGHTDSQPVSPHALRTYPTLWDLAMARALAVLRVFEASGIARERIAAVSYADTRPVADNKTEEGRSMNRRVEIAVIP